MSDLRSKGIGNSVAEIDVQIEEFQLKIEAVDYIDPGVLETFVGLKR